MNWPTIEGKWQQLKGRFKEQFGKLTDDDLDQVQGRKERLAGMIQEKYGKSVQDAEKELEEFAQKLDS